jgi:hypothetical protein
MSMTMLLVFTGCAFIFMIFGLIMLIPWRNIIEKHFGNNPQKARVFILFGEQEFPTNGQWVHSDDEGYFYTYKWMKMDYQVFVPAVYPWRFLHGRRRINVVAGQDTASSLGDEKFSGSGNALDAMIRSKIAVQLVQSVSGNKTIPWVIIAIAAVALIGGYFVVHNFMGKKTAVLPTTTPTISLPVEKPTSYLIKGWELINA